MTSGIDADDAIKVLKAFESGRLDQLFSEANTEYYNHEGFESLRIGVGVPREAVWRLISAIRRSTGLLVLESAWGDFQVRVTPTAQLMEALYDIDTWAARSLIGKTELPADEEWIVQDRQLVEEAVVMALAKATAEEPTRAKIAEARAEVIAAIYDETKPSSDAGLVATRFYKAMRALPDAQVRAISPEYIMDVHRLLRTGEHDAGMLRTVDLPVVEGCRATTPAARIMGELQAIHAYTESQDVPFIHPLVKSLALAWWIRRVRPFDQYNYLVSRLISMAFALRHGYRVAGIIEPGLQLKDQPAPEGDLTGAFIRQLKVISHSKDMGEIELQRRLVRFRSVMERFDDVGVNHRQALILDRALRKPDTTFTIKHHARTRELAYETARQDLIRLVDAGLMEQRKRGKAFEFRLAQGAEKRLRNPAAHSGKL